MLTAASNPPDGVSGAAYRLAVAITGYEVGTRLPLPDAEIGDTVFAELLRLAKQERLLGAVVQAVTDGALRVTAEQHQTLGELHQQWMRHALDVEAMSLRFSKACAVAGIELRVLKGVAFAHLIYPNPAWRTFGDVDVLVRSDQFDAAVELACAALPGERVEHELRPGFDREFGKEALVRVGRLELDIHRTFVTGPFGLTVDLDGLFDSSTTFAIGGHELAALEPTAQIVHACYNAALGDYPVRLCALRDLAMASLSETFSTDSVLEVARSWDATAVVQRAAELTVDTLDLGRDHPLTALVNVEVGRRDAWLLRSYLTPTRSYSRPLASLAVISGVSARLRYARALLRPSGEYLTSRGWTQRSHLKQARSRLFRRG